MLREWLDQVGEGLRAHEHLVGAGDDVDQRVQASRVVALAHQSFPSLGRDQVVVEIDHQARALALGSDEEPLGLGGVDGVPDDDQNVTPRPFITGVVAGSDPLRIDPGQIYTHRLAANLGSSGVEVRSLVVLSARDSGGSAADPVAVESGDIVGALVGDDLVLFPSSDSGQVTISGGLPARVWWTGLVPGADYSLSVSGGTLTLSQGGGLEADESGLLSVEISSGSATPLY
jgi:hypothetical protein